MGPSGSVGDGPLRYATTWAHPTEFYGTAHVASNGPCGGGGCGVERASDTVFGAVEQAAGSTRFPGRHRGLLHIFCFDE